MSVRMFERGKTNMNRRYRKTIIAGNWKMNKTPAEAKALIEEMKPLLSKTKWCEMVLCVPFTDIQAAVKAAKGSKIAIGAENMHFEKSGAFTGEISADMLVDLGVEYVIVGITGHTPELSGQIQRLNEVFAFTAEAVSRAPHLFSPRRTCFRFISGHVVMSGF